MAWSSYLAYINLFLYASMMQ
uniref:Uncharacterized protein n=1 Tax=Rhizophora mucronata TaxID=61149 RepID=A0A2P2NCZ3_RHIMU